MITSNIIPLVTLEEAANEALQIIQLERSGVQTGYKTRYDRMNTSMMKWWRPGVILIAGLSAVGKSTLINNIEHDFTNPMHNSNADKACVVLHFNFEVPARNEMLRSISGSVKKSFAHLLSSEYNRKDGSYNVIDDVEMQQIKDSVAELIKHKILYVSSFGDVNIMRRTVDHVEKQYPGHRLVIVIDHDLLIRKGDENNDGELIQNTAIFAQEMYNDKDAICIIVHQLNNEIMKFDRVINNLQHKPKQIDLYHGAQIYWACTDIFFIHRPERIGIAEYTSRKIPTAGLVHLLKDKSRYNMEGDLYYKQNFKESAFIELTNEQVEGMAKVKTK